MLSHVALEALGWSYLKAFFFPLSDTLTQGNYKILRNAGERHFLPLHSESLMDASCCERLAREGHKTPLLADSVDQDQTAQNVQSDLDLHCPISGAKL